MSHERKTHFFWVAATILAVLGVVLSSLLLFSPFNLQKNFLDTLASDNNLESFTYSIYQQIKIISIFPGLFFLILTLYLVIFREHAEKKVGRFLERGQVLIERLKHDTLIAYQALIPSRDEVIPLVFVSGITILGAFFRYAYLWRPMGHDESYTFMAFAYRGLRFVLTDYHLPNNHVFHTILVNLFYQLFGDSPAVIRLPAFIAGIMIIPATYIVARKFYDWKIGILASSIVAYLPVMVDYSTTARGYTIITLFSLLLIALAVYVKDHINIIAWLLIVGFSSLGLYTIPTMIYPVGMTFTWLFLSRLIGDVNPDYGKQFIRYFILSMIGITIITGLLYSPIVLTSGIGSIIGNEVVETLSWSDFIQSLLPRIRNTWQEWNRDVLPGVSWVALIGLFASFFVPKLPKNHRIPLILAGLLWISTALLIQRVAPWPRIWLFLLPFFVIWISAGIVGLIFLLDGKSPYSNIWVRVAVGVLVIIPLTAGLVRGYGQYSEKLHAQGEIEQVADFLQDYLRSGDVVVVTSPDTVVLQYYLLRNELDRNYTEVDEEKEASRSIVVVNQALNQTLESVLKRRSYLEDVQLGSVKEIYHSRRFILYELSSQ
ncbi:MAG: glycosyltransferase family 39 protein [Anaerolineales bacterium]